jgi:3-oxoadipate enol-lactonase
VTDGATQMDDACSSLVRAVLSSGPLVSALPPPVRVAPGREDGSESSRTLDAESPTLVVQRLISSITGRLGMPTFEVLPSSGYATLNLFERVVSNKLALDRIVECVRTAGNRAALCPDERIDKVAEREAGGCRHVEVAASDGAVIRAHVTNYDRDHTVVVVPACGMPVTLCAAWMRALEPHYRVIVCETRGMFGDIRGIDRIDLDAETQASDLVAVMNHFDVDRAHFMAFCGGSVLALFAAVRWPDRVRSMVLWHGDYEFGCPLPRTPYQENLRILLSMAAQSRIEAAALRGLLCQSLVARGLLDTRHREVAHLVLYPFANDDLFFRYAIANNATMTADVSGVLGRIACPVFVATSRDDQTVHPAGSEHLAREIAGAVLHVAQNGDHLSAFDATRNVVRLVEGFWSAESESRAETVGTSHL